MSEAALHSFVTLQLIFILAALAHYLPLSMRQLDVGIVGYFAVGAYVSAIFTRDYEMNFALALALGAIAAGIAALIVDSLATRVRLSGFAYAIFSLSFAEALRIILNNTSYVGGTAGFAGIPAETTLIQVSLIFLVVVFGFWLLDRTRLGALKTAIADDEFIVPIFGVPLVATKLVIFVLGGMLGGLAGGLYAHYVLYIRPDNFGFSLLIAIQLPIVFGGLDRFYGAIAGTLILGIVPELVRGLEQYRLIFTAAATVGVLIVRPSGLITFETISRARTSFRKLARGIHPNG